MLLPADRTTTAEAAIDKIKAGHRVFVGTACAAPLTLVKALEARTPPPPDVELFHFLTSGLMTAGGGSYESRFRHRVFFVGADVTPLVKSGTAEYVPISLVQIPELVANGRIRADVALIQVSPPDVDGMVSLGISVDMVLAVLKTAKTIIAEVNPHMPRTRGETRIAMARIAHFVPVDQPVTEYRHPRVDDVAEQIARYVAEIIDDGATLQIDLGRIPNEALKYLTTRKDLGIHSNVITDSVVDLIRAGTLTGARKSLHRGKVVTSFAIGTRRLYDFVDDNPSVEFHPIEYVANPDVVAQNSKMVSLTQGFAIDLTGQVCADQFEGSFYGGVSTMPDFHRGAVRSPGGKSIVCIRATTEDGSQSRIRFQLLPGEGVTLARYDVHYVVSEFGIAYLFGKTLQERALALIEIAHPDYRDSLLAEAKAAHLVRPEQKPPSMRPYMVEQERTLTTKDGRTLLIRPARASDAMTLKGLFHALSPQDVYTRFFRRMASLSYYDAQRLCNVDFEQDVAFVAVKGSREDDRIVGTGAYFLNPTTNYAEVAYMIAPEWQGNGVGSALQTQLRDYAVARRVRGFVAEVLRTNVKMLALARAAGDDVVEECDGESFRVTTTW
jgi:acyl-CoA hydrolase/GNAT superfamily N-acetyltransferase